MDIVIIGTGNTSAILGRKLRAAGHRIVQVYGRNTNEASQLAYELDTESTNYWNVVNRQADLYLICVSDIAVDEVVKELGLPDRTIVHTAASVPMDVLAGKAAHYGVFYPLQTLKKGVARLPDTPLLIDGDATETIDLLQSLGHSISNQVSQANDETRAKLHLAAVIVNNFTNHLYALVQDFCAKEGLDFSLLLPLIRETVLRLGEMPAAQSQTGPAARGDEATLQKHLALLQQHPQLQKLYSVLSNSIRQTTTTLQP